MISNDEGRVFFIRVPTLVCVSFFPPPLLLLLPLVIILFGETSLPLQCGRELNQKTKTTSTTSHSHQMNMASKKRNLVKFPNLVTKKRPLQQVQRLFWEKKNWPTVMTLQGEKT